MNLTNALEVIRITDVGRRREHNEDAVASDLDIGLVVLADGMGGYNAGEVASQMAILTIIAELKEQMPHITPGKLLESTGLQQESQALVNAVNKANEAILSVSQSQPQCAGMGTTLVAALFTNNKLIAGHIGDSRIYRMRGANLTQMTEDHSLLQEQLRSGLITPEQAKFSNNKNLVTRALGIDLEVELEVREYHVEVGDIYLLCSDGLTDLVDDEEIELTLLSLNTNLELAANQLIQMANDYGGKDNVSVILVRVLKSFAIEQHWYTHLVNWLR